MGRVSSRLIIAPDGPLCYVSFAALPGSSPGSYLLEEHEISYVSSGQHLYRTLNADPARGNQGLLLVGGILYRNDSTAPAGNSTAADPANNALPTLLPPDTQWENLEGSAFEIERIRDAFLSWFCARREHGAAHR